MSELIEKFLQKNNHLKIEKIINNDEIIVIDEYGIYKVTLTGYDNFPVRLTSINSIKSDRDDIIAEKERDLFGGL